MVKRTLGLGKAKQAKKQKTVEDEVKEVEKEDENQLTVELAEEADADDEFAQLKALWKTYLTGERDDEQLVNGVIHECDGILRTQAEKKDPDQVEVPDFFYAVYGQALAELAKFHSDDDHKVDEFFKEGLERIATGLEKHPRSVDLAFAKAKVLGDQLPLQYISRLTIKSEGDLSPKLDAVLAAYDKAEEQARVLADYSKFNQFTLEIIQSVDDVLDIVDNFGKNDPEDESDDGDDDEEAPELPMSHPLYNIRHMDKYNNWWREHTIVFLEMVDAELHGEGIKIDEGEEPTEEQAKAHPEQLALRRKLAGLLGQSYLQEAEVPQSVYTTLKYDDDHKDTRELSGLTQEQAQRLAQELLKTALKYLAWAVEEEEPDTWVTRAEAMISLGNMYELDSAEQEEQYKEAEAILKRANNATNGKYADILENLLGDDEEKEE